MELSKNTNDRFASILVLYSIGKICLNTHRHRAIWLHRLANNKLLYDEINNMIIRREQHFFLLFLFSNNIRNSRFRTFISEYFRNPNVVNHLMRERCFPVITFNHTQTYTDRWEIDDGHNNDHLQKYTNINLTGGN